MSRFGDPYGRGGLNRELIDINKHYDTVVFDLDGTLLNSLDDLADSVNTALLLHGLPPRTVDEVRQFVGNGIERLMSLCVPEGTVETIYLDCLNSFRSHYSLNMRNKTVPYAGILELLAQLKQSGYKLAVVSNKFNAAVKELCLAYFKDIIDVAIGASANTSKKPSPDSVIKALGELMSVPERAVYVGDSEVDAATAKNAGLVFVGVTWGFRGREVLERSGADYIIDAPDELLIILAQ